MKTIIACTDFSPSSVNACRYAALMAQKLQCKLVLFNMSGMPMMHANKGLYAFYYITKKKVSQVQADYFAAQLELLFPTLRIEQFISSGNSKIALRNFERANHVQAAVIGLEAKNRSAKFIYGSHGISLAGHIKAPVIVVPQKYTKHRLSNVLLAVDNYEMLHLAFLSDFNAFISETNSTLGLLHVRSENEVFDPVTNFMKVGQQRLPVQVIGAVSLEAGIRKYCVERRPDLIAIISKKHSVYYSLFAESTTRKVIFASAVPVMAIHE